MTIQVQMIDAGPGDALTVRIDRHDPGPWHALIDGGPPGTAQRALVPALQQLRPAAAHPVELDLIAVTHIDSDHIGGVIELLDQHAQTLPLAVRHAWHNSFARLTADRRFGDDRVGRRTLAAAVREYPHQTRGLVASVTQGATLTELLDDAGLGGNAPFDGLIIAGPQAAWEGGPDITVVGPSETELVQLRRHWEYHVNCATNVELAARNASAAIDRSVTNLASLVFLLEHGTHRLLFTGDARGDRIVSQLRALNLLDCYGHIDVDLVKLPHHGSDRSCTVDFLDAVHADHYLISGNGQYGNPSALTAQRLARSLRGRHVDVWLTHPVEDVIAVLDRYPNIAAWIPSVDSAWVSITFG